MDYLLQSLYKFLCDKYSRRRNWSFKIKESDNPFHMKHSSCGMCSLYIMDAATTEFLTQLKFAEFHILMFYSRGFGSFLFVWGFWIFLHYRLSYLNLSNSSCIFPYLNFTDHLKIKYELVIALYLIGQNAPTSFTLREKISLNKKIDLVYLHSLNYTLHLYKKQSLKKV